MCGVTCQNVHFLRGAVGSRYIYRNEIAVCDEKSRRIWQFLIANEVLRSSLSAVITPSSQIDCILSSASVRLSHSESDLSSTKSL